MTTMREKPSRTSIAIAISSSILALAVLVGAVFFVDEIRDRVIVLEKEKKDRDGQVAKMNKSLDNFLDPIPPGTIIASVLKPRLFLNGRKDWRLADASRIPEGALLELVKDKKATISDPGYLPDLRGMFLRGQNERRKDGKQDPDERLSGSYQSGATKLPTTPFAGVAAESGGHTHEYTRARGFDSGAGTHARAKPDGPRDETGSSGTHRHAMEITSGGDSETRPANVSVYFYIKIN